MPQDQKYIEDTKLKHILFTNQLSLLISVKDEYCHTWHGCLFIIVVYKTLNTRVEENAHLILLKGVRMGNTFQGQTHKYCECNLKILQWSLSFVPSVQIINDRHPILICQSNSKHVYLTKV